MWMLIIILIYSISKLIEWNDARIKYNIFHLNWKFIGNKISWEQ